MKYLFRKQIREQRQLRESFMDLAVRTFDLSFESWYRAGFWTEKYIPYIFAEKNKVVANASVNIMDTVWQGEEKRYIQIGTVMTDPAYRQQGLCRKLIEKILDDWKGKSDCVYLFANNTVLDLYPKFGFVPADEHQYELELTETTRHTAFTKLNMDLSADREVLARCYQQSNPYSILPMNHNFGLLMFYCDAVMSDCIYYDKEFDMVCIAERQGDVLICCDIFGKGGLSMEEFVSRIAVGIKKVLFGFAPKETAAGRLAKINTAENDERLFILGENLFSDHQIRFPVLSHA